MNYGIPEMMGFPNGAEPQSEFERFVHEFDFKNVTSNPYFPQVYGCNEEAVKIPT